MRLLHKSSEAREMLCQLQENAHKLKQLPRRKLEPGLVEEILQAIAEQPAQAKQPAVKVARRRWLPYVVASMAAALLISVLGIVYWKAMDSPNGAPKDAQNVAKAEAPDRKHVPPVPKLQPLNRNPAWRPIGRMPRRSVSGGCSPPGWSYRVCATEKSS